MTRSLLPLALLVACRHAPATDAPASQPPDSAPASTRSYYKAVVEGDTAYLMPRPDTHRALNDLCADPGDLADTLARYGWCDPAVDPGRVNAMVPAEADALVAALEARLRFEADGNGVWPYPAADDVAAVCAGVAPGSHLADGCRAYAPREDDLGVIPSLEGGRAMAAALNALHGIR